MRLKLPARPDLGYLKKQAKTLRQSLNHGNVSLSFRVMEHLPGYQRGDRLSLSDAQLVIAREYGFSSWPKLKDAVEALLAGQDSSQHLPDNGTVHITCGDFQSHTLLECGIPGLRLPWRDLFNIGPIPATDDVESFCRTRARFICEWTRLPGLSVEKITREDVRRLNELLETERVIFWLWPHLTHQLTLLFIMNWLADNRYAGEMQLINSPRFPRQLDSRAMAALYEDLKPVNAEQIAEAQEAWNAVRSPSPEKLLAFVEHCNGYLPSLRGAMLRYLEELPAVGNGLSRTEFAVIQALRNGALPRGDIYKAVAQQEDYPFIGDWGLWKLMSQLLKSKEPLIRTSDGREFSFEPAGKYNPQQQFLLTEQGETVCRGEADNIDLNGIERWWGGLFLSNGDHWRFDKQAMSLIGGQ